MLAPLLAVAEREPWLPALAAALAADGRALTRLGQREQARAELDRAARLAGRARPAARAARGPRRPDRPEPAEPAQMSSASRAAARAAPSVSTGR